MGRIRQFDKEQALHSAMAVFWDKGFEAASMQMLTEAMGINRFSLYHTFGDKESLFRAALARYKEKVLNRAIAVLERTDLVGLEKVEQYIRTVSKHIQSPLGELGCMIQTTGVAAIAKTPALSGEIQSIYFELAQVLKAALDEAVAFNELDISISTEAAAQFIITHIQGMLMMRRAGAPQEWVIEQERLLLDSVGVWQSKKRSAMG